jgi:hypothetical protein
LGKKNVTIAEAEQSIAEYYRTWPVQHTWYGIKQISVKHWSEPNWYDVELPFSWSASKQETEFKRELSPSCFSMPYRQRVRLQDCVSFEHFNTITGVRLVAREWVAKEDWPEHCIIGCGLNFSIKANESYPKIVSGGQTGADRAALDWALSHKLPCDGWCPKGRKAEDGMIDPKYPLKESSSACYLQRTEWNVRDTDATVLFSLASSRNPERGRPSG